VKDQRYTYEDAGELIAGDRPEAWFIDNLKRLGKALEISRLSNLKLPRRDRARQKMRDIGDAAETLSTAIADSGILALLQNACRDGREIGDWGSLCFDLDEIARRAKLAPDQIRFGPGRDKASAIPALDAKVLCALVVIEGWHIRRGEYPSDKSEGVKNAVDALWEASGGPPFGKGQGDWRRPLKAAKESSYAEFVRTHLSLKERDSRSVGKRLYSSPSEQQRGCDTSADEYPKWVRDPDGVERVVQDREEEQRVATGIGSTK
jgi:hypothetical protein